MTNISQNKFRKWLLTFGVDQVVGIAKDREDRPLARFLRESHEDVVVTPSRIYADGSTLETPKWAREFMHEVDLSRSNEIGPMEAAKIIDEIDERI